MFKLAKLSPRDNYEAQKWMIHRGHMTDAGKQVAVFRLRPAVEDTGRHYRRE